VVYLYFQKTFEKVSHKILVGQIKAREMGSNVLA